MPDTTPMNAREMNGRGIRVVLVCSDVALRGELRDNFAVRRRLSDILNSGIDDLELFDAEALSSDDVIGPVQSPHHGMSIVVRRSAILLAIPVDSGTHRHPGWDTYVEKMPEAVALVVGDVIVRGNVWRTTGADLAMTMRATAGNFLPVTQAHVSRAPGSREPFSASGVAIVNRSAIRMWSPLPAIPVAQPERRAPERVLVAELVGTSMRQRVAVPAGD